MYRDPKPLVPIEYYNRFTAESTCQVAYVSIHVSVSRTDMPAFWLQLQLRASTVNGSS